MAVGIMASGVHIVAAGGELLLNDPCDNFTFAPWVTNGTVTISASGHTGNAFSFASGSTTRAHYDIPSAKQTDTLTVGCWLKLGTFNAAQNIMDFRSDAGATSHDAVRVSATGQVSIVRVGGSTIGTVSPAGTITTGTWYFVEASVKLHDVNGFAVVRVNGVEVAGDATDVDTKNAGTKTVFDQFRFNSAGSISTWFADDVYIRNDGTFLGPPPSPTVYAWQDAWGVPAGTGEPGGNFELGTNFWIAEPLTIQKVRVYSGSTEALTGRVVNVWESPSNSFASGSLLTTIDLPDAMSGAGAELFDYVLAVTTVPRYLTFSYQASMNWYRLEFVTDIQRTTPDGAVILPVSAGRYHDGRHVFPTSVFHNAYYGIDIGYTQP